MKHITSLFLMTVFSCCIPVASAEVQLTFDVTATQYTGVLDGGSSSWLALPDTTDSFQLTLSFDESNYQAFFDPNFLGGESYIADLGETVWSTPTSSVIDSFGRSIGPTNNAQESSSQGYNRLVIGDVAVIEGFQFNKKASDYLVSASGQDGIVEVAQFNESLQLSHTITPAGELSLLSEADDFLTLLQQQLGMTNAFTFFHEINETTRECLEFSIDICLRDTGFDGVRFAGNATLVSVSSVPVPAAGWLFASALFSLCAGRRKLN